MVMPKQKPGRSKQNYQTPPELLAALVRVTGRPYEMDLAADVGNKVALHWLDETLNALDPSIVWSDLYVCPDHEPELVQTLWLNPPFGDIKRFVEKAASTNWKPGQMLHVLVPASVGAKWFQKYVWGKAAITFLIGRIKFVGAKGPFPKDCMILTYGRNPPSEAYPDGPPIYPGVFIWDWRKQP